MSAQFTHGYALLVGVGQSTYAAWSLPATVKDVQAVQKILTDPTLCAYVESHIRLLHDAGATRPAILDGLAWLKQCAAADPEATAVVYYSGHGWLAPTGDYYLVPHDIDPFDIPQTALPAAAFNQALRQIPARRLLVIVDSCHAAGMATSKGAVPVKAPPGLVKAALPPGWIDQLKQGQGRAVFTSSRGEQPSWVRPDGSMSIYTYHLSEALQGAGNQPGERQVRLSNLMNHLGEAVLASTRRLYQAEQNPFFDTASEDFPVALVRGGKGLPGGGWQAVRREAAATIQQITHVEARGERSVAIGTMAGGTVSTEDHSVRQQGKYNVNIGEAQGVVVGDRSQVAQTFVGGDVRDSTVTTALGDVHVSQGASPEQIRALFEPIFQRIQQRPEEPDVEQEEIVEVVAKVRDETAKGEQANPNKVKRWLEFLVKMAPDIWDVVIKTLQNPAGGIAEVVRRVAERAKAEQAGQ